MVQLSAESLELHPSGVGLTLLDMAIDGFLSDLFQKWKDQKVNHLVSIVFFTRIAVGDDSSHVQDYYHVSVDWESYGDWSLLLEELHSQAMAFLSKVKLEMGGTLCPAMNGGFLEAIHLALMIFDKHFADRDLSKTGMSLIMVTPDNGHFVIDRPSSHDLCSMAKRKVIDDGIWVQVICLGNKPSHVSPLLEIVPESPEPSTAEGKRHYYKPYWMQYGFYDGLPERRKLPPISTSAELPSVEALTGCNNNSTQSFLSGPLMADDGVAFDPYNPSKNPPQYCKVCSCKWSALRRKLLQEDELSHPPPDWSTLVAPPCLPLTALYCPTQEELESKYEKHQYSITLDQSTLYLDVHQGESLQDKTLTLLEEMVALRIALGMQEVPSAHLNLSSKSSKTSGLEMSYVLSARHEIQILTLSEASDAVQVIIYERQPNADSEDQPKNQFSYEAWIRPKNHEDFQARSMKFCSSSSGFDFYPWQTTDEMLAGHRREAVDTSQYWQTRFMLIPTEDPPRNTLIMATAANEILDDEELRIAGFIKFMEAFQRALLSRPCPDRSGAMIYRKLPGRDTGPLLSSAASTTTSEVADPSSIESLKILLTTLCLSAYAQQEVDSIQQSCQSIPQTRTIDGDDGDEECCQIMDFAPLTKDTDELPRIAYALQHPLIGLSIADRRWHWQLYRSVLVGSEAVDWIMKFFEGVNGREDAVAIGDWLMDQGLWEHATGTHRFLDGYYFYRITSKWNMDELRLAHPQLFQSQMPALSTLKVEASTSRTPPASIPIVMSRSAIIDVDIQRRSKNRREWAILYYDSTHNPRNTFHFRLSWLTCSSRLIDDLIQSWARRAAQCGFVLLEAPVEAPILRITSPFQAPISIKLALRDDQDETIIDDKHKLMTEILSYHGFVLDYESEDRFPRKDNNNEGESWRIVHAYDRSPYSMEQWIHRSGVALVRVDPQGTFLWSPNRLLLASAIGRHVRPSQQNTTFLTAELELRKELTRFCSDPRSIKQFYTDK